MLKRCYRCKGTKAKDCFPKSSREKDGLQTCCRECFAAINAAWYKKNKERHYLRGNEWRDANRARVRETTAKRYWANPEKARAQFRAWQKNNRANENARWAKYRASVATATPKWADLKAIAEAYEEGAHFGLNVDHIVPITSKTVCGLHVWDNLQLLSASENFSKGNRHWPDMP